MPLPEHLHTISRNPLRLFFVLEIIVHDLLQIKEIPFHFDVILEMAGQYKELVVVLNPLEFVNYEEGLQAWRYLREPE
jgi:hypothetical protein